MVAPVFLSVKIRSSGIPAVVMASSCRSRLCLVVETLQYARSSPRTACSSGDIPKPYRKSSPYGLSGTVVAERLVERLLMAGGRQAWSFEGRSTSKELGRTLSPHDVPVPGRAADRGYG